MRFIRKAPFIYPELFFLSCLTTILFINLFNRHLIFDDVLFRYIDINNVSNTNSISLLLPMEFTIFS